MRKWRKGRRRDRCGLEVREGMNGNGQTWGKRKGGAQGLGPCRQLWWEKNRHGTSALGGGSPIASNDCSCKVLVFAEPVLLPGTSAST